MKTVTMSLDGVPSYSLYSKPKTFKSGSRGYYVWGKAEDGEGKRYQVICNLVEIGSKKDRAGEGDANRTETS